MNTIVTATNELVHVDYSDLLNKIIQVLQSFQDQNIFKLSEDRQRLLIDINNVAGAVASLQIDNPLGASANNIKSASVNFSPGFKENFTPQIQEIKKILQRSLESTLDGQPIPDFIANLATKLEDLRGATPSLNLTYPFTAHQNLQKQRLSFSNQNGNVKDALRFHKLTVTVQNIHELNQQLRSGLEKYIKIKFNGASQEELSELGYTLEDLYQEQDNPNSDFYKLKRILDREILGKLKKQAQIYYLEYLLSQVSTDRNTRDAIYLQDLIRRLRLVEEFISDGEKADGYYQVNYAGVSVNYRDLFSRGEAFEMLPIIPKIEGYLGETKNADKGELQFVFGLKLKFDGKAQAHGGQNSFQYYLNLLDPESPSHKQELQNSASKEIFARKVLKIAFLYYFLFASRLNPTAQDYDALAELSYNPIPKFEQKVLSILKGDREEDKKKLFAQIRQALKDFNVQQKINKLKEVLKRTIKYVHTFPTKEFPLHISVKQSLLETEIDNILNKNSFFKPVLRGNPKEVLKYIYVGDAIANSNSLCTLGAKIAISDIHYNATDDKQSFSMEYDIKGIRTLPVLFLPLEDRRCWHVYNQNFKERKLILFPYRLEAKKLEPHQEFVYQFTFSLLAYTCIKVLLEKQNPLFIPILRLHLHNKEDSAPIEKYIVSLSLVLSHLLNCEYRSNAQGIDIRDLQSKGRFKVPNVLSSLYSVLPKKFTFTNPLDCPQEVDKLAIVIVSSRESDRRWGSTEKISNLMGEILTFRCQEGAVRIQLNKTFSDNYEQKQMFRYPTVVVDEVARLYRQGYRHFVYIAKAPYTSTLQLTRSEDDDGLFFMSKDIIKSFKGQHPDIKIYPIFFDKYYAVKLGEKLNVSSLYIQDTAELTNLVDDPSQTSVVFFNLFNGTTVNNDTHYNGVISYATLLKIYKHILDDEDIHRGLISQGNLKNEILQYLTLFHFSRYEKSNKIAVKLDPYQNMIGDVSVGAFSLYNHMRGKGEFNSLAFLTEVKKILNVSRL